MLRARAPIGVAGLCALLLLPALSSSQGLADVARKEKQRRAESAEPHRSYTNADLPDRQAEPSEEASPGAASKPSHGSAAENPEDGESDASAARETSWRARATAARRRVEEAEAKVTALEKQGASPGLTVSLVPCPTMEGLGDQEKNCYASSGSDPLSQARAELEAARTALAGLQDSARRARVPPGWLR